MRAGELSRRLADAEREVAALTSRLLSAPAAVQNEAAATAAASVPTTAGPDSYKVAKGDNPYNIAKKLGVNSQELLKLNGIEDPTKLQIGQVLKVPGKSN